MKTLIGITGKKGVGKSTLSAMLKEEIPGAEVIAFADALKQDVADMVAASILVVPPIGRDWLDAHKGTVFGPLCQGIGSLMREVVSQDYWVDVLADEIEGLDAVIIPDVRYENEAAYIHKHGGLLVAIEGPSRWVGDQRDTQHPSESNVDKVRQLADVVIHNSADLAMLGKMAKYVVSCAAHNENCAAKQWVATGTLP